MTPPYSITPEILRLVSSVSEKIGSVNAVHLSKPTATLRKKNRIKTIQSSLEIEGNTLSIAQITALLDNKRVLAPQKDILEVKNAIKVYDNLKSLKPNSIYDFLKAHKVLMEGLIGGAGQFRLTEVGIVKGSKVAHLAPPGHLVNSLMTELFNYLKTSNEIALIKSCVFHYELEFIHPFIDGNGRMGRLWQTVILMKYMPLFEFLPMETIIKEKQKEYYKSLTESDKAGESTIFIQFMLGVIDEALARLLKNQTVNLTTSDRLDLFKDIIGNESFSRQDFMNQFKEISTATASRDLKYGVDMNLLLKQGEKRMTKYIYS